jgi:L-ascorbate metabolism protein UlaG (beta-lactamase superfamily)
MTARRPLALALLLAAPLAAQPVRKDAAVPSVPMQSARSQVTVRWLGHATFEVTSSGGTRLLIDPFVTGNPATPDSLKSLARYSGAWRPSAILVSHSHDDHSADAKAIAQASGAPVISAYEWASTLGLPQAQVLGGNVGGKFPIGDVIVHIVPAVHSSEPGRAVGFVLEFPGGRTLYHTGDTWIFGDMALIQERFRPSIILMNVGGGPYTMDARDAALGLRKWFTPRTVIPMHFGTFPGLNTEAQVRASLPSTTTWVMRPGETRTF